jgi:CheY-like chemotaxis protein/anti-sigma regulatory factor (Ser/Thr protein kinase)
MKEKNETILAVDDHLANLILIRKLLKDTGYNIHSAQDGDEAWSMLSDSPHIYTAVLLDRMMPKMDGLTVLKKMKSHDVLKQIPVIFQTSMKREDEIAEGISAGAYYYLAKPLNKKILVAIVNAAVYEFKQYRSLTKRSVEITDAVQYLKNGCFEFRTLEQGRKLSTLLGSICSGKEKVIPGLWELISNAIEHGNLGINYEEKSELNELDQWEIEVNRRLSLPEYASKTVSLQAERKGDEIHFIIQDQGKGFDWKKFMTLSTDRAFDNHGRGIAMANTLSFDRIEYQGCGNRVLAVVECPNL